MPKPKGNPDIKTKELAHIHIAKEELGLDNDTYRARLMQLSGVSSSKDLTATGRAKVLEHLKQAGFKGKKTYTQRPHSADNKAQILKIEALLADMQLPWDYLMARQQGKDGSHRFPTDCDTYAIPGSRKTLSMVERLTGKKRLEWCTKAELSKVIAALAIHQKKLTKGE